MHVSLSILVFQAYSAVAVKPAATGRLLKAGIAVLIAGALLLLLGAVGAFYFWNNNEKHVRLIMNKCTLYKRDYL